MFYWSLVPDNFGLDTHVVHLSADLREEDMLWRFPEGLCLYSACPQHGQDCSQDKRHWAKLSSGNKGGVQAKTMQKSIPTLTEKATHHGLTAQGLRVSL